AITYVTAAVMIVSAIANEIMSRLKIKYGKKYDLISLISDGIHSKVDVLTSVAVLIGLILSRYFIYADSIIAFLIGLYILKESFTLGRKATDSLLDISAGDEIENRIETIVKGEEIKIQDMKTQKRGSKISAEINIRLPKNLKVNEASAITKKLEKKLIDNIDNLEHVTIQITSHEISESYFKGLLGAGMGWQRRGRMDGKGLGVYGSCVCPKCGHKTEHIRGVPCTSRKCPKCNTKMERDDEDGKTTETQKSRV
ncbi:MAG: cation diffusion facilitator family transporter, partial [archaeon]|nr:cation diffusion facilitator family transporter [archaeon]